jgi:hypothetical protein
VMSLFQCKLLSGLHFLAGTWMHLLPICTSLTVES